MWTVTFYQNTEIPGRGTFVAFNDGFSFSADQIDVNDTKSVDDFVVAAKAAFAEFAAKQAETDAAVSAVAVKLNEV